MISVLLLLAAGQSAITGDFDRDGRVDRVRIMKVGEDHRIVMSRSFGDTEPVEASVTADKDFKFSKVNRKDRTAACLAANLKPYMCDAGDVLQYGPKGEGTVAIWNGNRFVLYRGKPAAE